MAVFQFIEGFTTRPGPCIFPPSNTKGNRYLTKPASKPPNPSVKAGQRLCALGRPAGLIAYASNQLKKKI